MSMRSMRRAVPSSQDWRSAALIGRPQIVHALGQYDLAEINLQNEVAKRWPEMHLTPGYAWGATACARMRSTTSRRRRVGCQFRAADIQSASGADRRSARAARRRGQHLLAVQADAV
jgi:outer membrane protein TolC